MSVRHWPLVLLIAVLVTLYPLAYSDLPDQTWLSGIYDGGDEDDAIAHIETHLSAVAPSPPPTPNYSSVRSHAPAPFYTSLPPGPVLSGGHTRAPPLP